jgi:threonine/homoserine/homoserine lactone efflux protein
MRQGWLSNVLNPKAPVFIVTFLPQLRLAGEPAFPHALALSPRRARVQAWLERVIGACLLGFGARLALSRH